jgi:hypothetical protein
MCSGSRRAVVPSVVIQARSMDVTVATAASAKAVVRGMAVSSSSWR